MEDSIDPWTLGQDHQVEEWDPAAPVLQDVTDETTVAWTMPAPTTAADRPEPGRRMLQY
ncbi:hypothetical protein [Streptomyces sp. KS 21]|uniref:hypothetical protein n=1 Tax=Streptomyces sp. KS 21 TaxID=2485150 RepID=UPI001414CE1B|nr:hypothetical protein [Streptomyces sp. KS 21]